MKSAVEVNVHKEMEKEVKRLAGKDVALTNLNNLLKKKGEKYETYPLEINFCEKCYNC